MTELPSWQIKHAALRGRLSAAPEPFVTAMTHGTMRFLLFAPQGRDVQTPHRQDELYIVSRGAGWFVRGDERCEFQTSDALFVPAGLAHRFDDFTADFEAWVVFWGPAGGETVTALAKGVT